MPKRKHPEDEENFPNIENSGDASDREGESEDLFGDNYMDDYRTISELDTYDASDTVEESLPYEERQRIEHEMRKQENSKEDVRVFVEEPTAGDVDIKENFVNDDFYTRKIVGFFVAFLNNFSSAKYVKLVRKMCAENEESLYVSYLDLEKENDVVIKLLLKNTEEILRLFDKGLEVVVKMHFPHYSLIKPKLHARIVDVPVLENIRSLRNNHLSTLVRVNGIVTRRSNILPLLSVVKFNCLKCSAVFGPFVVEDDSFRPSNCFECQSKGPFAVNSAETVYKDYQKLTLQEIPGTVPAGSLPRSKEILCYFDLIDKAKPGDEIEVIGVYKNNFSLSLNIKNGFPVFFTAIEAVSIMNKELEFSTLRMSDDDVKEIKSMAQNPRIVDVIIQSIAPSIFGFRDVKKAIALALFSGERKVVKDHVVRGDINVLLLGDPGTAKSQFLRYVQGVMHKSVLTTGQGSSSVGLTASVQKDPVTKEWTLEGGALVLADKGICLIDEFDKMNEVDRTSIHEAMEQQTVSISKAGIVTSLNSRCGVIAAANPIRGRYNSALTFNQNVNLSDPIITRFDILCVVKDVVEITNDERMAEFILDSHDRNVKRIHDAALVDEESGVVGDGSQMSQEMLRKYIIYARMHANPAVKEIDLEKISQLYSELRKESFGTGGIPITVRHIESIVRMSEAFAKMRLANLVSTQDIDEAIAVALSSFVGAQKYSVMKNLRRRFSRYLVKNEGDDVILYILAEMFNEKVKWKGTEHVYVACGEFENVARSHGFAVSKGFYGQSKFKNNGYRLEDAKIVRAACP